MIYQVSWWAFHEQMFLGPKGNKASNGSDEISERNGQLRKKCVIS